jgi:hypothetical protein
VAPSDDPEFDRYPLRRPLLWPVVIAAVLLAIVGASVGLVMGARTEDRAAATRPPAGSTQGPAPTSATPSEPACRTETQAAAGRFSPSGTLRQVLQIRTAYSGVWICSDAAGRLFYHANRGGAQGAWIEGKTALLLPDAVPYGDGYRVRSVGADGLTTTFDVSSERLLITHANGREEYQAAQ